MSAAVLEQSLSNSLELITAVNQRETWNRKLDGRWPEHGEKAADIS